MLSVNNDHRAGSRSRFVLAQSPLRRYDRFVRDQSTMNRILVYVAATAIACNVAANWAANTAKGLQERREARSELLCTQNPAYCPDGRLY